MFSKPITLEIKKYIVENPVRCHTPGHSGKAQVLSYLGEAQRYDVTEVRKFDALFEAEGVIEQSEKEAAEVLRVPALVYSAGGCTLCIQAMLALSKRKGKILAARNSHRSLSNAAVLLNVDIDWFCDLAELKKKCNESYDAVYVTSPDYYGFLSDIKTMSEIAHKNGAYLLVDNAHGAHLSFESENCHPITIGADMSADSLHKTLPVLTGGAALCLRDKSLYRSAKEKMSLFGSTSPSYLILSSIEAAVSFLEKNGKAEFLKLEKSVSILKETAREYNLLPDFPVESCRLTLKTANRSVSGKTANKIFESFGVTAEFYDSEYIVLILTPFMDEADFIKIQRAIIKIGEGEPKKTAKCRKISLPEKRMALREAFFGEKETVKNEQAVGRVAAESISRCPPGIPVVMPGEVITKAMLEDLNDEVQVIKE